MQMFSKSDANQLREQLQAIEFLSAGSVATVALNEDAAQKYSLYKQYYGLDFPNLDSELAESRSAIGIYHSGPYELVCQHFLPDQNTPRKTAFLLHGYFDHAGLYGHLIRHLLRRGIAVVIFDLPGHGLSSGATASIGSFQEYDQALLDCLEQGAAQDLATPWVLIGQSTGGAIIMDSLLEGNFDDKYPIQQGILLGPLLRPRRWLRSKILFNLSKRFVPSTPRNFSRNSHDLAFLDFLKFKDDLQSRTLPRDWVEAMFDFVHRFESTPSIEQALPLDIIQGKGDGTVEWETNVPKILQKFPGTKVHWIEEAGHHLVNESTHYREQAFAFIDEVLAVD